METSGRSRITPLREVDLERVPLPLSNIEAEQALLGAILINNAAYHRVADFLTAEHFANAVHGRIYVAIGELIQQGSVASPITLKNRFEQDSQLTDIGGAQYLGRLAGAAVTIVNAPHYGKAIVEAALLRLLTETSQTVIERARAQAVLRLNRSLQTSSTS